MTLRQRERALAAVTVVLALLGAALGVLAL